MCGVEETNVAGKVVEKGGVEVARRVTQDLEFGRSWKVGVVESESGDIKDDLVRC